MILDFTFVHEVAVQTHLGGGTYGATLADPVTVPCYVQDVVETVQNPDGTESVSVAKLNAPLSTQPTYPAAAGQFAVQSQVTTATGRTFRVIAVSVHTSGSLNLGLDHVQVHLK